MSDPTHPDYCWAHNAIEPMIEGAPVCGECFHQFASDDDLMEQHNALARKLGLRIVESGDDVYVCPFCAHDL